jgi:hypothetical protein
LILLLAGALSTPLAQGALSTYLEPRLVDEMDTVPDLTPLTQDFEVLGNQRSSRIVTSLNGRTMASVEYQISLRPRRTGELTVPSLVLGSERSEPVQLVVRPLDPELKQTIARMVFFETELSRNPVYVQAETVLTRRLYYSQGVQIYSDLPGLPEVADAVVLPLGETQSRSVLRGGVRYGVIEQRFAVFPQQSGTLRIPSISVTSSVRLQSGGRTRRSGIRVSTEDLDLDVLPIPTGYPADTPWLPATDVRLAQRWTPPARRIDVGEPLRFALTVQASGNRGSAIPPVGLPLPGDRFKVYPEAPEMDESADTGTVVGRRSESYALIPTTPGYLSVPPVGLTWWDTDTDELRRSTFHIEPLEITGTLPPPVRTDPPDPAEQPAPTGVPGPTPAPASSGGTQWLWFAGLGGMAALLLGALLWWLRGGINSMLPALSRAATNPSLRPLKRSLRDAANSNDPRRFRARLPDYLAAAYRLPPAQAMLEFRRWPETRAHLEALDRVVYGGQASTPDPDLVALLELATSLPGRKSTARADVLPPLYA